MRPKRHAFRQSKMHWPVPERGADLAGVRSVPWPASVESSKFADWPRDKAEAGLSARGRAEPSNRMLVGAPDTLHAKLGRGGSQKRWRGRGVDALMRDGGAS